jgi:acyl dehydratase
MAYAAGLGETDPRYFDTSRELLAHPLFPVCYEWPVSRPVRLIPALAPHFPRLVHAEHDLVIHRAPRGGDRLSTQVRIRSVEGRKPGAFVVFRFETRDAAAEPVSTTDFGVLYRGVPVEGPDRGEPMQLDSVPENLNEAGDIPVAANLAHVYTECARIWNPIHTDSAHARAAGLPGIILHGTATLALSISKALAAFAVDPAAVRRVRCRFSGMVLMPSVLKIFTSLSTRRVSFETRRADGEPVIRRGSIELR